MYKGQGMLFQSLVEVFNYFSYHPVLLEIFSILLNRFFRHLSI